MSGVWGGGAGGYLVMPALERRSRYLPLDLGHAVLRDLLSVVNGLLGGWVSVYTYYRSLPLDWDGPSAVLRKHSAGARMLTYADVC